jgi:hypothetical protein
VTRGERLKSALDGIRGLRVVGIAKGSNIFQLFVDVGDPLRIREFIQGRDIELPAPSPYFKGFALGVNETLARRPVAETVQAFADAMRA